MILTLGSDPTTRWEKTDGPRKRASNAKYRTNGTKIAERGGNKFTLTRFADDEVRASRDVRSTLFRDYNLFTRFILIYWGSEHRAPKCRTNATSRRTRGARTFYFCSQLLFFSLSYYCFYPCYYTRRYAINRNGSKEQRQSYLVHAMEERAIIYRMQNDRDAMRALFILLYRYTREWTRMSVLNGSERTLRDGYSDSGLLRTYAITREDYKVTSSDSEIGSRCANVKSGERSNFNIINNEHFILRERSARAKRYGLILFMFYFYCFFLFLWSFMRRRSRGGVDTESRDRYRIYYLTYRLHFILMLFCIIADRT